MTCDGKELIEHPGPIHGLAIDAGTTTVVMHVVDLQSGRLVEVRAFENGQRYGGSDPPSFFVTPYHTK